MSLTSKAKTSGDIIERTCKICPCTPKCSFIDKEWVPLEEAKKWRDIYYSACFGCERIKEITDVLMPQLDLLKINRSKEGTYKIVLSYEEITCLREVLK